MCEGGMVRVSECGSVRGCACVRACMCEGVHVPKSEWKDMGRAERSLTGKVGGGGMGEGASGREVEGGR